MPLLLMFGRCLNTLRLFGPRITYILFLNLKGFNVNLQKRLSGLNNLSYKDRLLVLGVDTLERRRLFYDLSLFYKFVH